MIIKWLEDALHDLQSLREYIHHDNPSAAEKVAIQILKKVNMLSEQPGIGRFGRVPDTRELVISGTPYIISYRVKEEIVEILRILHGAMQWPDQF